MQWLFRIFDQCNELSNVIFIAICIMGVRVYVGLGKQVDGAKNGQNWRGVLYAKKDMYSY